MSELFIEFVVCFELCTRQHLGVIDHLFLNRNINRNIQIYIDFYTQTYKHTHTGANNKKYWKIKYERDIDLSDSI